MFLFNSPVPFPLAACICTSINLFLMSLGAISQQGRVFMNVVDCDAHVEESVETWSFLEPEFYLLRPAPVLFPEDTCFGS
jgi:hypothetical protein